jgi:hypothetical protein
MKNLEFPGIAKDSVYRMRWRYPHKRSIHRDKVICEITVRYMIGADWKDFSTGMSNANLDLEKFSIETGRRKSLKDALKNLPKETRIHAWDAYWHRMIQTSNTI